jgi:SNF2 family DNA or RNA helicase
LELPPQEVTIHSVEFSEETHPLQYRAYYDLLDKFGMMFNSAEEYGTVVAKEGASMIGRLRQVTSCPAGIVLKTRNPDTGQEKVLFECDITESAKLDAAFEEIVEKFEQGIRTVFFAKHVAVLKEMQRRIRAWQESDKPIRSAIYNGETPLWRREEIQNDFDAKTYDPVNYKYDIVLCQLEAASQGLNFTAATHMCVVERPWGPKLEEQMLARTNRIGQTQENTVSIFQIKDTIDEDIEKLLYSKKDDVEQFENSAEIVQKLISQIFKGAKKGTLDAYE